MSSAFTVPHPEGHGWATSTPYHAVLERFRPRPVHPPAPPVNPERFHLVAHHSASCAPWGVSVTSDKTIAPAAKLDDGATSQAQHRSMFAQHALWESTRQQQGRGVKILVLHAPREKPTATILLEQAVLMFVNLARATPIRTRTEAHRANHAAACPDPNKASRSAPSALQELT